MARYTTSTKLSPSQVIDKASKHFGSLSRGATAKEQTSSSLCFETPDGHVTLSVCSGEGKDKKNVVEIETSQFDAVVKDFLRSL